MHFDLATISGISGCISIASWCTVFSPQLIKNFRRSSAEGLSVRFVVVWLAGDVFNILGAVLQGVLPTMIILAMYYCISDLVLLGQCFYYKGFTLSDDPESKPSVSAAEAAPNERSALLSSTTNTARTISDAPTSPGAEQARSSFRDELVQSGTQLSPAAPMHKPQRGEDNRDARHEITSKKLRSPVKAFLFNLTAVLIVCAAGVLGWWLSTAAEKPRHPHHHGHRQPHQRPVDKTLEFNVLGQVFGYICAALYLGSRFPQLLLNYRRQSTDGISMLFFIFACIGNATYVAAIMAYEPVCERPRHCGDGEVVGIYWRYVLLNLSWLFGSFGTLLLDLGVFAQYFMYRSNEEDEVHETAVA